MKVTDLYYRKDPFPRAMELSDPLSEVTRKERKKLLGFSIIGIIIAKTGLVPQKITALGIEFDKGNQRSLLVIIALVILYFLVAFVLYASSDFLRWRIAIYENMRELLRAERRQNDVDRKEFHEIEKALYRMEPRHELASLFSAPVSLARALFEFILPVAVGLYSIIVVWMTKTP